MYDRLLAVIPRYTPHWGEILYTLEHWDDSLTEMENVTKTSDAFGYTDTTGVTCSKYITRGLRAVLGDSYPGITALRGVV